MLPTTTTTMSRLFCFGLGYTAGRLAHALLPGGWSVAGTRRNGEPVGTQAGDGTERFIFDRDHPLPAGALEGTTHILHSVPPDAAGDPVYDLHADGIAALPGLAWMGYLSTTGVYGDSGGGWVDETSPLRPSSARTERRVKAESRWLDLGRERSLPVHVFRLAGIYGPGRSVLDQLRAGTARRIGKPGQVFSRIHVDDIVAVLRASMDRPAPGAIYNVCDDRPAPQPAVIEYAASLLGIAPPPLVPFEDADLSPMAKSFYADSRRVRNDRIKSQLGVRLAYPDYETGLRAILAGG